MAVDREALVRQRGEIRPARQDRRRDQGVPQGPGGVPERRQHPEPGGRPLRAAGEVRRGGEVLHPDRRAVHPRRLLRQSDRDLQEDHQARPHLAGGLRAAGRALLAAGPDQRGAHPVPGAGRLLHPPCQCHLGDHHLPEDGRGRAGEPLLPAQAGRAFPEPAALREVAARIPRPGRPAAGRRPGRRSGAGLLQGLRAGRRKPRLRARSGRRPQRRRPCTAAATKLLGPRHRAQSQGGRPGPADRPAAGRRAGRPAAAGRAAPAPDAYRDRGRAFASAPGGTAATVAASLATAASAAASATTPTSTPRLRSIASRPSARAPAPSMRRPASIRPASARPRAATPATARAPASAASTRRSRRPPNGPAPDAGRRLQRRTPCRSRTSSASISKATRSRKAWSSRRPTSAPACATVARQSALRPYGNREPGRRGRRGRRRASSPSRSTSKAIRPLPYSEPSASPLPRRSASPRLRPRRPRPLGRVRCAGRITGSMAPVAPVEIEWALDPMADLDLALPPPDDEPVVATDLRTLARTAPPPPRRPSTRSRSISTPPRRSTSTPRLPSGRAQRRRPSSRSA